ncbi:MAG: hypothetical protein KG075_11490 [Alphaproteobacteria bacterium]|nr:hypothetical protein [Alphaproteobacteria bacterium]
MTKSTRLIQIPPPESTISADTSGSAGPSQPTLAAGDLAAEAAALEACQVSARLAAAALSLTNLRPDGLPRLLQRP